MGFWEAGRVGSTENLVSPPRQLQGQKLPDRAVLELQSVEKAYNFQGKTEVNCE